MPADLADLTWPEVESIASSDTVLAIPLGATEQHGPHLPLSTDTDIATALCERLTAARPDVVVAPAVPYGSSGEHEGFAGTLSIGQAALELLLVELCRSATRTFDHILIVCGHGGNAAAARGAVRLLQSEGRDVHLHLPRWQGDAHAGRVETSLQLALAPGRVRVSNAVVGDTRPLAELMPLLQSVGMRTVSASGILGDPTGATAAEGGQLLTDLVDRLIEDVGAWRLARVS
jgi:mycofactocin precursor peptide peptidase